MEVDELEGGFLQQFSSMQTVDRYEWRGSGKALYNVFDMFFPPPSFPFSLRKTLFWKPPLFVPLSVVYILLSEKLLIGQRRLKEKGGDCSLGTPPPHFEKIRGARRDKRQATYSPVIFIFMSRNNHAKRRFFITKYKKPKFGLIFPLPPNPYQSMFLH